ncbi:tetratricopeptide repeat-containing sulfotransferase family protein [Sphingopyxis sp. DBS4]|jgi:tetratricopeptide (TPR) repeat protein|uniref:tetratricopeptide repeat-containing sulfotransferase family protein n=1 Tax=Sphingopyxis sp. DBS4 TaxID=2968500 RepID=UPI00214BEEE1|nr:tetratricopeptide repeat-containing sulfotransferase family protein [Sphingopyxis sp. DBS4]
MKADRAQASIARGVRNPELMAAALALVEGRLHDAEPVLKAHLKRDPFDVAAIRMLAELAGRIERYRDAEALLRRALELAPDFLAARSNLATVLHRQGRSAEAIAELDALQQADPGNLGNANLKAAALGRVGEFDEALELYQQVLQNAGKQPKIWMSYGHMLKTVGRQADAVAAYRQALALNPALGEVWWSLANLKTLRFDDADVAAMEAALDRGDITPEDRFHLHFALGRAEEQRQRAEAAFAHYDRGNALRRTLLDYDADQTRAAVDHARTLYTTEFFRARSGHGAPAPDPIFIVGMPRAGSTLIEQILSSHSLVEGTMELPDIPKLYAKARGMGGVAGLTADQARELGEQYLRDTQVQRKSDKPFYIDKLPNNWLYTGFIRLILPNARIVDARRHPMDCCFSNFKQHFARGQAFSYSLSDMGRYYADYVGLMDHFDHVLPGHVHRVFHERVIADLEGEVRALLTYLGLPFEPSCLDFHKSDRAVRTASSEQVRRPINRDGVDQWRAMEPWLGPLVEALGPVLADYPASA